MGKRGECRSRPIRVWATLGVVCIAFSCTGPLESSSIDDAPQVASRSQSIVNGQNEDGFPAVGAMTLLRENDQYEGSFCSGTLIDPRWVLTAAHCIEGARNRLGQTEANFDPTAIHFYIGATASDRNSGSLHRASQVFVHPKYFAFGSAGQYDIALMELQLPVDDVEPHEINRERLDPAIGQDMLSVGFGQSNGDDGSGAGRKRSKVLELIDLSSTLMVLEQLDGGVCFGDSGGPALIRAGEEWRVAGVNSVGFGQATCLGYSAQVRADSFSGWIDNIMGGDADCRAPGQDCLCEAACGEDGVCDPGLCAEGGCDGVLDCLQNCGSIQCQFMCFARRSPLARYSYERLIACVDRECPENRTNFCVNSRCTREVRACFEGVESPENGLDCEGIYWCQERCRESGCVDGCVLAGSLQEQLVFESTEACLEGRCPDDEEGDRAECFLRECSARLQECLPADNCSLMGGDCSGNERCRASAWGASYCVPSEGREAGAVCDPYGQECVDGTLCVSLGGLGHCEEVCVTDGDCELRQGPCEAARYPGLPCSIGLCTGGCLDRDADGACDAADCAPDDESIGPGQDEVCQNDTDDDCDGVLDEDCSTCNDLDGDGLCGDVDCDDEDPSVGEMCPDSMTDTGMARSDAGGATSGDAELALPDGGSPTLNIVPEDAQNRGCSCAVENGDNPRSLFWLAVFLFAPWVRRRGGVFAFRVFGVGLLLMVLTGCIERNELHRETDSGTTDVGGMLDVANHQGALDAAIETNVDAELASSDVQSNAVDDAFILDATADDIGFPEPDMLIFEHTVWNVQRQRFPPGTEIFIEEATVASPVLRSGFFIAQGPAAAYSGLWVALRDTGDTPSLEMGAVVSLSGVYREFDGDGGWPDTRSELVVEAANIVSEERVEEREPVVVPLAQLANPVSAELMEGVVVQIDRVSVQSKPDGGLTVLGVVDFLPMFLDEIPGLQVAASRYSYVRGPIQYVHGGFGIAPRDQDDLGRPEVDVGNCIPLGSYSLCLEPLPFGEAEEDCLRQGGQLIVMGTAEENEMASNLIRQWTDRSFWIGLTDRDVEGQWQWLTGEPLAYESGWANGEPNDYGNGEDCAESNWRNVAKWNDAACGGPHIYVCEFPLPEATCTEDIECGENGVCGAMGCQIREG